MSIRSDIHSALTSILAGLSKSDRAVVLRECVDGSEEEVAREVADQARRELLGELAADAPVPDALVGTDEEQTWCAGVEDAMERPPEERTLDCVRQNLMRRPVRAAERAEAALPATEDKATALKEDLRHLAGAEENHFAEDGNERSAPLVRRLWGLNAVRVGVIGIESFGVVGSVLASQGVLDYASLSLVPRPLWTKTLSVGIPAILAAFVPLYLVGKQTDRFPRLKTVGAFFMLLLSVVLFVGVTASLGALRWVGLLPATSVTESVALLVGHATLVIVVTSLMLGAALVEWLRLAGQDLRERIEAARKDEQHFASRKARLEKELAEAEKEVARLQEDVDRPDELRACFEGGVKLLERQLRHIEAIVVERRDKACSAWRRLQTLSREDREQLQRLAVAVVPPGDGDGDDLLPRATPTTAAPKTDPSNGAGRSLLKLFLVLVALLPLAGSLTACGAVPEAARDVIVVCDGTGVAPEAVCTPELLQWAFTNWSEVGVQCPRARFQVVQSAGAFGEIFPEAPFVVPARWDGDSRMAPIAWRRDGLVTIAGYAVPRDTAENRRVNKSDLLSALIVTAREARNGSGRPTELLVASDGWLISAGFNSEDEVPTAEAVLGRLEAQGIPWDLSGFSATTFCGLHSMGATAAQVAARDLLWRELIEAGGGPSPALLTTCQGLYGPVDAQLLAESEGSVDSNADTVGGAR